MTKFYLLKRFCQVAFLLTMSLTALAQQRTVSGKVTASDDRSAMPGVNVIIKGTTVGTTTDADGNFSLGAESNATLVFSFVGYKTAELVVGSQNTINVTLDPDARSLSEVVVVGYGTQERAEVTGSYSTVKGKDLQNVSIPSFDAGMQGRAPGVQVVQSSGIPGSAVRMRIRGQASISGSSDPLYIVDGVPITTGDFSKRDGPANGINTNALADINPNDIESMEVLKDAAAAAIYGARAANGVVIVTTKRGKAGKTLFNAGYYQGTTSATHKLNFINSTEYLSLYDEAYRNTYGSPLPGNYVMKSGTGVTPDDVLANKTNTNWRDKVLRTGSVREANLNASGGTEKTRFYVGGTYRKEDSYFVGNSYQRINGRINVDHKASDILSIGTQTSITGTTNNQVPNLWGTVQEGALPTFPVYNPDGTYFGSTLAQGYNTGSNPSAQLNNKFTTTGLRLLENVYANLNLTKELTFRSEFGLDFMNQFDNIYTSYYNRFLTTLKDYADPLNPVALPVVQAGSFEERRINVTNWNANNYFKYTKVLDEHKIDVTVGFAAQQSKQGITGAYTTADAGFSDNYYTHSSAGLVLFDKNLPLPTTLPYPVMGGYNDVDTRYSFVSYFARANYVFRKKFLAGVSMRADGSSRFGPNNKYGYFPAVSAGWILSEENFIKNVTWISFLKARASFGHTGNAEIGNFQYQNTYGPAGGYLGQPGVASQRIANPNLHWEKVKQVDIGFDFGFLQDRITGTLGFYNKQTSDLIYVDPIQSSTGYTGVFRNTGIVIRNRGVELNVATRNIIGSAFTWTTDFNIASNQNTALSTGGLPIEAFASGLGESRVIKGRPVGQTYVMKSAGVDPTDGREMFYNNEGGKEKMSVENTDYRHPVGKPFPNFFGGINNTLKYKGFELSFLFTFSQGNTIFDNEAKFQIGDIVNNNQRRAVLNRWQSPENPGDGKTPGLFLAGPAAGRALNSDRFSYDASFLRLRTLTFAYTLPSAIANKIKMNSLRVFVSGQNLLLFTKFPGWDPEFANTYNQGNTGQAFTPFGASGLVSQFQQSNLTFNAAQNPYPQTRTFSAGLNFSF